VKESLPSPKKLTEGEDSLSSQNMSTPRTERLLRNVVAPRYIGGLPLCLINQATTKFGASKIPKIEQEIKIKQPLANSQDGAKADITDI